MLAVAVAIGYGSADFLGGRSSQRSTAGATVLVAQACGLALILVLAAGFHDAAPARADVLLSMASGVAVGAGLACLYRGLAVGRMSIVAPVSAVGAAVLQVGWGLATGERPPAIALAGVAVAIGAVVLVTHTGAAAAPDHVDRHVELLLAIGAAVLLGASLIFLAETDSDTGLWPVVVSRATLVPLAAVTLAAARRPLRPERADLRFVVGSGVLDVVATALLLVAVREDLLSLVAPVAALYPAATVVLAHFVLGEPIRRDRALGLATALVGLALIAAR